MKYFTIQLKSKSEEELKRRIAESENNGFELVKIRTESSEGNVWQDVSCGNGLYGKTSYEFRGTSSHESHIAIMRRDNTEYLKSKGLAQ